ncbi:histone-lysine N-methyltransferase SETMAR-like [Papilio machaon]|uniref:histone-lysine N-methyltransferase SETMAR-like n=1 Tax=Papilio machaon TaxID=76193 RepID=UPI0006EAEAE8|nr:histone-lysine N-methyltransferase SETMAR-like [Papilio machaon]
MDAIFEKVEQDWHISSYDVAEELGIEHKTVLAHLKENGYTKKLDIWVPHELSERNLMNRVLICDSLLRRNETEPFLKKLITGDEKWITYDKNVRKRSWSKAGQASQTVAKPGLTRNKVMLCVWWDWKGIIHYELLPPGRTIDSELLRTTDKIKARS